MNFEQFHLPGFLLRDLYKESLVELNEIQQTPDKKTELNDNVPDHVLGNNQKKVLILVNYTDAQVISDPELTFLLTILKACKLTLNDVVIVNFAKMEEITYQKLVKDFMPKTILLFGVEQASLNMPILFPEFQVQSFKDIRFLSSPPLQQLQQDDLIKRKLWTGLKQLFLS
jgi:DNA polymerase III psi subunit